MRCLVCGHESPLGSSFCLNCGSALAPAVQQTPAAAPGLPVVCGVCHGENPPGMKFCRACGAALASAPAGPPGMVSVPAAMIPPGMAAMPQPMVPQPMQPMQPMMPAGMPPSGPLATPVPPPPRPSQPQMISCPRCGTSTPVGFAYCQQCGLHMQGVQPTDPAQSRMRTPSSVGSIGGTGVDAHGATIASPDAMRPSAGSLGTATAKPAAIVAGSVWGSAVLVNRDGSDGQRFALGGDDVVVGRAGADIAFDDDRFLARQHARLERAGDGAVRIHPIDLLNGVFKKTDAPVELADGATVLVGREVLQFEKVGPDERSIHPLVRHGVALFGSPPREPWGRLMQLVPSGGHRDVRHLVADEIVLGREEGDIVFRDDAFMSRRHAAITWDGKRAQLTDLGSSNGTFVRVAGPTALKHGDHVRMGDQLLRIELAR